MQNSGIKAVILAAGLGNRMQNTQDPKSSLFIGPFSKKNPEPVSLIGRQVSLLKLFGVEKICIAVGYRKEVLMNLLSPQNVQFVENTAPDISQSGSLQSFQFVANSEFNPLDEESHTLLMDADIVYEACVLENFLDRPSENSAILIAPKTQGGSEEVRVLGDSELPRLIGKGIKPEISGSLKCLGEACGIIRFAPKDHRLVKSMSNWLLGNPKAAKGSCEYRGFGPAKQGTEHEELSQRLMILNHLFAEYIPPNSLFMEVDFETEYNLCKNNFYPQILNRDHEKYPKLF